MKRLIVWSAIISLCSGAISTANAAIESLCEDLPGQWGGALILKNQQQILIQFDITQVKKVSYGSSYNLSISNIKVGGADCIGESAGYPLVGICSNTNGNDSIAFSCNLPQKYSKPGLLSIGFNIKKTTGQGKERLVLVTAPVSTYYGQEIKPGFALKKVKGK